MALAGVYGGYFGAAQGIILISILGIMIDDHLQRLNGCRQVLGMAANLMAAMIFVVITDVDWKIVVVLAVGSAIGGRIGARYGRRLDPRVFRALIVTVGITAIVHLV